MTYEMGSNMRRVSYRLSFRESAPAFTISRDMTICVRRYGTQIYINLYPVSRDFVPKSCFEHSCAEVVELARHLQYAYDALEAGGIGADHSSNPLMTKICAHNRWAIKNQYGLTMDVVVLFPFKIFCSSMYGN
jgi:hypothetical protein